MYVHEADAVAFTDEPAWNAGFENRLTPVKDLRTIVDGEALEFAGCRVEVTHTPGHTPGHCIFRTDALVLSGDLVFAGSIGRSDLPNSDPVAMQESLRRFLEFSDDLKRFAGPRARNHRRPERASNPFLAELG